MKGTIKNIQQFLSERGWDNLKPDSLAKSISIEANELLELFQWKALTLEEIKNDEKVFAKIKKELADVLIYSFEMALMLNVDVKKIMDEKLKHNSLKYPADLMKERSNGEEDYYLKQKEEYRKQGI